MAAEQFFKEATLFLCVTILILWADTAQVILVTFGLWNSWRPTQKSE